MSFPSIKRKGSLTSRLAITKSLAFEPDGYESDHYTVPNLTKRGTTTTTPPPVHASRALAHFTNNPRIYNLMHERASSLDFGTLAPNHAALQPTASAVMPIVKDVNRRTIGGYLMPGRMKSVTMGASKAIAIRQMNDVEKMIAEGVVAYWEARKPEREAMEKQRTEEGERKMQEQLTALTKNVQETDLPKQVKEPSSDEERLKNACNSLVDCRSGRGRR